MTYFRFLHHITHKEIYRLLATKSDNSQYHRMSQKDR